ncbi:ubiquitin fusion degradation protein [Parelaphostrongylus tenuis]|uniref:Ubiquitin fusion degradation protein n=1 Tax=Parelaphostrongylus tenuis TaxID=148309 RepID=A0AAD5QC67_PARTN|nr:ubiquitin fusion degradation protein [Parelaphostrongylus tenuis]
MMKQLRIDDGAEIRVDSVTLPSATYAKLKPQSLEFLNISNPRAVLEVELRKFACLTKKRCYCCSVC